MKVFGRWRLRELKIAQRSVVFYGDRPGLLAHQPSGLWMATLRGLAVDGPFHQEFLYPGSFRVSEPGVP